MSQGETIEGVIEEALPGGLFNVVIGPERIIMAHLSGKIKFNHIRIMVGDRVKVVLDPYKGKTTNRIVERL